MGRGPGGAGPGAGSWAMDASRRRGRAVATIAEGAGPLAVEVQALSPRRLVPRRVSGIDPIRCAADRRARSACRIACVRDLRQPGRRTAVDDRPTCDRRRTRVLPAGTSGSPGYGRTSPVRPAGRTAPGRRPRAQGSEKPLASRTRASRSSPRRAVPGPDASDADQQVGSDGRRSTCPCATLQEALSARSCRLPGTGSEARLGAYGTPWGSGGTARFGRARLRRTFRPVVRSCPTARRRKKKKKKKKKFL